MENKKRALGRGLEQLFNSENLDLNSFEANIYDATPTDEIKEIKLEELRPNPYQPRVTFDEEALKELALSIEEHGIFQPIIVKESIKGYEIIAGERRCRAAKMAGLKTVPAIIRSFTDEQMMEIALLENLQRENLNAIEEAMAYKSMLDKLSMTQEELAVKIGKSRSHITNMLGLLRLPEDIKSLVVDKTLSMAHARMISKLESEEEMYALKDKILKEGLNVRQTEQTRIQKKKPTKNNEYKYVEDLLKDKLDTRVKLSSNKIEIRFTSTADLNRILEVLNIKE